VIKRVFFLLLASCFAMPILADELSGLQIIEKAQSKASGLKDIRHEVQMVLIDEKGNKTEREMLMKAMTDSEGNSYSLLTFTAPSRDRGIALLTIKEKQAAEDAQYLYLPSTRRTRRILSASKSTSFRGSEFTFEDLSDQETDLYRFELVKNEKCLEWNCYVVDRFPKQPEASSYSKTTLWIDADHFRLVKADFYDQQNKLLKTLKAQDYKQIDGGYWNPSKLIMSNLATGKRTEMISKSIATNVGLEKKEFNELAMRYFR